MSLFEKVKSMAIETATEIKARSDRRKVLQDLSEDQLYELGAEYGVPLTKATSKEDMISRLAACKELTVKAIMKKGSTKPDRSRITEVAARARKSTRRFAEEEVNEKITIERKTSRKLVEESEVSVDSIKKHIQEWSTHAPRITGKNRESKMSLSMTGYLQRDYPQLEQQKRFESTKIDAVIYKIGIEAKYGPDQNEINRLYGQIDDYLRYLEHIIVVFYETDQTMISNFRRKIETGGYSKKVTLVKT